MASNLIRFHTQILKPTKIATPFSQQNISSYYHVSISCPRRIAHLHGISNLSCKPKILSNPIHSSLAPSTLPNSKEEAILQAKTCLSKTLEKPLNNPKLVGKLKKLQQPRFQVEIPVIDDSPSSLSQLALDLFKDLPIKRKGSPVKTQIFWPNPTLASTAAEAFKSLPSSNVEHADISSVMDSDSRILGFSAEVAVFLAPEKSQLSEMRNICDSLYPKPVVIFNPKLGVEDEETDFGELSSFVGSFDVIYSFMGLEVRGILSKRKGVVFKCVRDGVVSGEKWTILVEDEQQKGGELKVVSRFKTRPSIGEVENVLYNLMAMNSPITKSAKFFKALVSNVTGKKYVE